MSVIIESNDRELWSPSLRLADLFRSEFRALESLLDLPCGLVESLPDTIEVETAVLRRFVDRLIAEISTSNNGALIALSWGCAKILIALLASATGEWPEGRGRGRALIEEARTVFRPANA